MCSVSSHMELHDLRLDQKMLRELLLFDLTPASKHMVQQESHRIRDSKCNLLAAM